MSYEPPYLSVQQEFQAVPPEVRSDQIACIIGPSRKVSKPGVAPDSEIEYGDFNPSGEMTLDLKGLPAGESADQGSVKLFVNELLARYAEVNTADKIQVGSSPSLLKIGSAAASDEAFAAGDGAIRLSELGQRDVQAGDRLRITHPGGELNTRVVSLLDSMSAPTVGDIDDPSIFNSPSNPSTTSASYSASIGDGTVVAGRVTADIADGGGYAGDLSKGIVSETYTLTVTVGGTYSVAEVSWTSSNGDDSGSSVIGSSDSDPMAVGTRGASVEFQDLGARPLEVGEIFHVTVGVAYTRAEASATGTYTGAVDTAYVLTVVKGGLWVDSPKVSVISNNGVDASSIQTLTQNSDPIILGNRGLSIELDGGLPGLRLGDVFVVTAGASAPDGKKLIRIAHPLPIDDGGNAINSDGDSVAVEFLSRQVRLEIPAVSYPEFADENWTHDGASVVLSNNINVYDPTVLSSTGDVIPIPVVSGQIEIHYTATLLSGSLITRSVSSTASVEGILGPVVPENELAFATYYSLLNSGGVHVVTIQTAGHTVSDYNEALRVAERLSNIYFIVPASNDDSVLDATIAHIGAMNEGRKGMERVAIINKKVPTTTDLFVNADEHTKWSGYIAADGLGGYTRLTMPGASFVDAGVRSGDVIRAGFSVAPDGSDTYEVYVILEVIDQENAILLKGPSGPIGDDEVLTRIELFRINSALEIAEASRNIAESIGNRKVFNIFPDSVETSASETVSGFNLAAAVAGLASSVVGHQPITEFEIQGFSEIPLLLSLTPDELDIAAGGGNLIVAQDLPGDRIYIRHQISTDNSSVTKAEMSITRGADMVARYLRTAIRPMMGQYNITPEFLQMIETLSQQRLDSMVQALSTLKAGPPILSNERIRATQDPSIATGFIVDVPVVLPKPANKGTIRIFVS